MDRTKKTKIAILGGGVGAITTAFALTSPHNPKRDQYDITIYQIGWRLGGKGASGRNMNPAYRYRIEEHGLHIWFGCYDNAFRVMQECYGELQRAPDAPLATWKDAFKPHSAVVITQRFKNEWILREGAFPTNNAVPGTGELLPVWYYVTMAIDWIVKIFGHSRQAQINPTGAEDIDLPTGLRLTLDTITSQIEDNIVNWGARLLHTTQKAAKVVDTAAGLVLGLLDRFMKWYWAHVKDTVHTNADDNWYWTLINFLYTNIRGVIKDNLIERGFDAVNDQDYRAWLSKHCFPDGGIMINSSWLIGIYDGMFAYIDGDNEHPEGVPFPPKANMEAGIALRIGLRQYLTYKGAAIWKMQAGMGDTVFAPLYEVLRKRGVKFRFFHQVEKLALSADRQQIAAIHLARQVTIRPEQQAQGGYDPLVNIQGLPCWPSTPLYDQIVEGEELKARQINLEDPCAPWEPVERLTLQAGQDFDQVVLGISLGALPELCGELIDASTAWKQMITHMRTTRTMGVQLWMKPTAYELGWTAMKRPILSGYEITPLDTWADMSHLIGRESWRAEPGSNPDAAYPQNIAYLCGPLRDIPPLPMTPHGPIDSCAARNEHQWNTFVKAETQTFLQNYGRLLWPNAYQADGTFRWDWLVDGRAGATQGIERLDAQFFRANVIPSERYVLSVAGSSQYRLPAHDRDFANLFLAGDWTDCHMNVGCVEAATMSGLLAAEAISGYPRRNTIVGLLW